MPGARPQGDARQLPAPGHLSDGRIGCNNADFDVVSRDWCGRTVQNVSNPAGAGVSFSEDLHDAILDAFSEDELEKLLNFKLGLDFDRIVAAGPREDRVYDLLKYLDRRDRLGELIDAVQVVRPKNDRLKKFADSGAEREDAVPVVTPAERQESLAAPAGRPVELAGMEPQSPDEYLKLLINREPQALTFSSQIAGIGTEPPFRTSVFFLRAQSVDKPEDFIDRLQTIEFGSSWSAMPKDLQRPECHSVRMSRRSASLDRFTLELKKKLKVPQHSNDQFVRFLEDYQMPLMLSTWIDLVAWNDASRTLVGSICDFWAKVRSRHQPISHLFIVDVPDAEGDDASDHAKIGEEIEHFAEDKSKELGLTTDAKITVLDPLSPIRRAHAVDWVRYDVHDYCEDKNANVAINDLRDTVSSLFENSNEQIALKQIEDRLWAAVIDAWRRTN